MIIAMDSVQVKVGDTVKGGSTVLAAAAVEASYRPRHLRSNRRPRIPREPSPFSRNSVVHLRRRERLYSLKS